MAHCDAPRGFWKGLYDTLLECGLKEVPMETSAYYLPGAEGQVLGLLGTHVDDLLWCGTPEMDEVMLRVQERYKFRITNAEDSEDGIFKFCGRLLHQTNDGVTITSPGVLESCEGHLHRAHAPQAERATSYHFRDLTASIGRGQSQLV